MKTIYVIHAYHQHNNNYILTWSDAYTDRNKAERQCNWLNDNAPSGVCYKMDILFIHNGD